MTEPLPGAISRALLIQSDIEAVYAAIDEPLVAVLCLLVTCAGIPAMLWGIGRWCRSKEER